MPRLTSEQIAERAEMARLSDLAGGFAGMARDRATKRHFGTLALRYSARAMEIDGPVDPDVAAMSNDDLLRELGA